MNKKKSYYSNNSIDSNFTLSNNIINENEEFTNQKIRKDFFGNIINKNKKHKISFSDKVKQTIQIAEEIEINRKLSVIEDKEEYDKKNIKIDPFKNQGTLYQLKFNKVIMDNSSNSSEEGISEKEEQIINDKVNLPCQSCSIF